MSPSEALHSDVFLAYLAIAAGLLAAAGLVLAILKVALHRPVDHAWAAYRGWLVMIPLVVAAIFLGREATVLFLTGVALVGLGELARASGLSRDRVMTGVAAAGVLAVAAACLWPDLADGSPGWYGLLLATPVGVGAAAVLVPILRNRAQGQLRLIGLVLQGFVYAGFLFGHVAFLTNSRHAYGYLCFLILAVEASDVAAYSVGRWLGRHRLRSAISPNKTWEGAAGGLGIALALPWLLRLSFPPHFGAVELVLVGLCIGVGGQLGDLSMSLVKRELGVKDMGHLIPGHGGVLDRIDSLIFAAPLFCLAVRWRQGW